MFVGCVRTVWTVAARFPSPPDLNEAELSLKPRIEKRGLPQELVGILVPATGKVFDNCSGRAATSPNKYKINDLHFFF
jgi:hypothetical protein